MIACMNGYSGVIYDILSSLGLPRQGLRESMYVQ